MSIFQCLLSDQLLQPLVLTLELLQPLRLISLHPTVLRPPPVERRLRDLQVPQHLSEIPALVQQPFPLTDLPFLRRAVAFFERHGMTVQQLLTDNGPGYRSMIHALACRTLEIKHLRTRAYRPQTNGKAERFIRTMLGGWAYSAIYRNSHERTAALDGWLWYYNHHRKHSALSHKPPIARLNERTNLLGTYS